MKKIITLVVLLILPLTITFAKTEITQKDFETYMEAKGYRVVEITKGSTASNYPDMYSYTNYDSLEEAITHFKGLYEEVLKYPNNEELSNYNLNNYNTQSDYSMIEYKTTYKENGYVTYYYIYRIHNSVVYGNSSFDRREEVKKTVDGLLDDSIVEEVAAIKKEKEKKESENKEETEKKEEKEQKEDKKRKENKISIKLILTIIIIIALIIFILSIIKVHKK